MAGARCSKCDAPIQSGTHCVSCAGNASTMIASGAVTAAAAPKAVRKGDPLIGAEVIGQYVIREQIGKGGMGKVYLAEQPSVGRRAVIKVLHPNLSRDADIRSRFETEARAASQLTHSNIVTVYNYGAMTDGTLFLAMEHLDGQTLAQANEKRRLPLPRVVNIVGQIANALGEAHRRNVIHRDVKPTNVMLVQRDEQADFVKVLDFGIAHIEGTRVTATGDLCGTPTYMSPEQIRGKAVDGRSDLYSLGCMLFELLTGEVPFEGDTTIALAYQHANEEPPRVSSLVPKAGIPPALDAFVARTLAKDPAQRPQDAAAFRDELRAAVAEPAAASGPVARAEAKPVKAIEKPRAKSEPRPTPTKRKKRDTGVLARAVNAVRSRFRRKQSLAERFATKVRMFGGRTRRQRRRWPWLVAVGVLVVALAGTGWYVLARRKSTSHESAQPSKPPAPPHPPAKPPRSRPASGR